MRKECRPGCECEIINKLMVLRWGSDMYGYISAAYKHENTKVSIIIDYGIDQHPLVVGSLQVIGRTVTFAMISSCCKST